MEPEELIRRQTKQIRRLYTEIVRATGDTLFRFPEGGKANETLARFVEEMGKASGGQLSTERMVDYCVFQIHKNRNSSQNRNTAVNAFGTTAMKKYREMTSKGKTWAEDTWMKEYGLDRARLAARFPMNRQEHPLDKFIYMAAEEGTKNRFLGTGQGALICATATLMWSPFSEACRRCRNAEDCEKETAAAYPELYRIRKEAYDQGRRFD